MKVLVTFTFTISFPFPNSDLPAFTPRVCTVYCCPCSVSVICLLHVSVYVGIDRRALSLNSFEVKRVLASVLLLLLLLKCHGEADSILHTVYG